MEQMDTGSTTSSGNFSPGMQADAPSGPSSKIDNPIDEEAVYICCGKPFGNKFMIFCEKCEEWFHGECIGIEQVDANNIDKYFCKDCLGKDNSLQIVYTRKYMMKLEKKKKEEEDVAAQRCGNCSNCLKAENKEEGCKTCVWCQSNQSNMCLTLRCSQAPAPPPKKKAGRPRKDQALTRSTSDEEGPLSPRSIPEDKDKPKRGRKKGWKKVQIIEKVTKQEESQAKQLQETTIQKRLAQAAYRTAKQRRNIMTEEPKQCLGIECVQEARPMSKYCSDDCGRSIARARLLKFLPQKVQEYWEHIPSVEIRYQQQAKEKEEQVLGIHKELSRLVDMAAMLERFVTSYVNAKPMEEAAVSALEGLSNCTVCGVEVSTRQLTAHVQRCFIKSEKQTAFGSTIQENQYNIFCNEYNKVSDTYCKRLKIMCPEHYKGELEGKMQICGCPSLWDSFKDKTPTFKDIFVSADQLMAKRICLAPRKECTKHQRWLQIALGVLSNERLNLLYKLNEIQEGYLASTHAQAMHGDVITLLCSGTREGPSEVKAEPMES